jgi:hypothetical protein
VLVFAAEICIISGLILEFIARAAGFSEQEIEKNDVGRKYYGVDDVQGMGRFALSVSLGDGKRVRAGVRPGGGGVAVQRGVQSTAEAVAAIAEKRGDGGR